MPSEALQVKGLKELSKALEELGGRDALKAIRAGVRAGAAIIGKEARSRAPVDTGELRRGIKWQASRSRSSPTEITFVIGPVEDVFYGMFLELGTSKVAARPFLRPAIEAKSRQAVDAVRDKTSERIRKTLAKRRRR